MRKMYKSLTAAIATISLLATTTPAAIAFGPEEPIFGVKFTTNFAGKKTVVAFSQQYNENVYETSRDFGENDFLEFGNRTITTKLPLATFGPNPTVPGIFYNQYGPGFCDYVMNAAEEGEATKSVLPYVLGGLVIGGVALAVAGGGGGGGSDSPVVEEEKEPTPTPTPAPAPTPTPAPEPEPIDPNHGGSEG